MADFGLLYCRDTTSLTYEEQLIYKEEVMEGEKEGGSKADRYQVLICSYRTTITCI